MSDVFISYSRNDTPFVKHFFDAQETKRCDTGVNKNSSLRQQQRMLCWMCAAMIVSLGLGLSCALFLQRNHKPATGLGVARFQSTPTTPIPSLDHPFRATSLEGHSDIVMGVLELQDGQLLSWSDNSALYLRNTEGERLLVLLGVNDAAVWGAMELRDGRILSWNHDGRLYLREERLAKEVGVI